MPIRFYEGLEGAGKTCMMARDSFMHHLSGGEVYAFPGFDLKDETGKIISKPFLPQDMVNYSVILNRKKVLINFDEVTSWINNHNWQNKFADLVAAVMAQRRKLEVALWMSGPVFERLPPIVQEMIHEIVHCTDLHTLNHRWPRGEFCRYYKEDRRGLLSNPRHRFSRSKRFHTKPWWPYYETYSITEFSNQFIRMKFKGREIVVGPDGKIMDENNNFMSDTATLDRYINQYNEQQINPKVEKVKEALRYLKGKGMQIVNNELLCKILGTPNLLGQTGYGSVLKSLGAKYNTQKKLYDLSGIP